MSHGSVLPKEMKLRGQGTQEGCLAIKASTWDCLKGACVLKHEEES